MQQKIAVTRQNTLQENWQGTC